jgi:alanine racemase
VDTGQQRFACPIEHVEEIIRDGLCTEAYTHAMTLGQVQMFRDAVGTRALRLHAAGSSLLGEPPAWLDAVRPGLALYRGAARVSTTLVETRKSTGPAGYSGFGAPYHGIILAGYSNGLRAGPCLVNGRASRILEVGMQSAFVETEPTDRAGDEVVLLGDSLAEQQIAPAWNTSPHECLVRLTGLGVREYVE